MGTTQVLILFHSLPSLLFRRGHLPIPYGIRDWWFEMVNWWIEMPVMRIGIERAKEVSLGKRARTAVGISRGVVLLALLMSLQVVYGLPPQCHHLGVWFTTANENRLVANWNTPIQGMAEVFPDPEPEGTGPIEFELSERSVPSDYLDYLDAYIGGLSMGQTVRLERFLVRNDEGIIDENAILLDSRLITDGFLPLIGEEPNYNETLDYIEIDQEAVSYRDGEIETYFPIRGGLEAIPGEYVYRVSSPRGSFPPKTQRLSIVENPTDQRFAGRVLSEGVPVPGAIVGLMQGVGGRYSHLKTVAVADAEGNYSLSVPFEDEFEVVAVASGYVGPLSVGSESYISAGELVERDIDLVAGSRTIAGRVVDSVTGMPIAGLPVTFVSGDEEGHPDGRAFTHAWTNRDGGFSVTVTPDRWGIVLKPSDVSSRSYLTTSGALLTMDTTVGDATGLTLPLVRGDCMVSGYLRSKTEIDESGQGIPLEGVEVFAVNLQANLTASGVTYEDGWFNLAVTPGHWVVLPFSYDLKALEHSGSKDYPVHFSGPDQSIRLDIEAPGVTGGIAGVVEDAASQPIGKLRLIAYNQETNNREAAIQTSYRSDGAFSFLLNPGTWIVMPDSAEAARRQLLFRNLPTVSVPDDEDFDFSKLESISLKTMEPSGRVDVSIKGERDEPVAGIKMHAMLTQEDGTVLDAFGETNRDGNASIPVVDGEWKIHLSLRDLREAGKKELPLLDLIVTGEQTDLSLTTLSFQDQPTRLAPPLFSENGIIQVSGHGEPGRLYEAQRSRDLDHWMTLGLISAIEGAFTIVDDPQVAFGESVDDVQSGFYRVVPVEVKSER